MRSFRRNLRNFAAAGAGSVLVISGCDTNVRDTVLGGVENAATTLTGSFIQAFFESLAAEEEDAATIVLGETARRPLA